MSPFYLPRTSPPLHSQLLPYSKHRLLARKQSSTYWHRLKFCTQNRADPQFQLLSLYYFNQGSYHFDLLLRCNLSSVFSNLFEERGLSELIHRPTS